MAAAAKENGFIQLKQQIKENKLSAVYLMYGEEAYIKNIYIEKLRAAVDTGDFGDFNELVFEGSEADLADIADAIDSFPVMSEKKVVIVRSSGAFSKPREAVKEFWTERLKALPEYLLLIFDETEVDKRSSLYKAVAKIGTAAEFSYMSETDTVLWIQREAASHQKKIKRDTAQYLASVCDDGLLAVKNELDKLVDYSEEEILRSDIDKVVSKSLSIRIFELTDGIMEKNADKVYRVLYDLKTIREPAFKILYLLLSSFDKMLRCSLLLSEGESYDAIARTVGIKPFVVRKYTESARGFGENYLTERVAAVAEADLAIKEGETDEWRALEDYIADCIRKK